jgi:hypothetical protein
MDPPLQRHHSSGLAQSKDSLPSLHWIGHCRVTGFPNVEKKIAYRSSARWQSQGGCSSCHCFRTGMEIAASIVGGKRRATAKLKNQFFSQRQ